jgi:hypothetical protein
VVLYTDRLTVSKTPKYDQATCLYHYQTWVFRKRGRCAQVRLRPSAFYISVCGRYARYTVLALYGWPIMVCICFEASTSTNTANLIPSCLFKDGCCNWNHTAWYKFFRYSQRCSCGLLLLRSGDASLDDLSPTFRDSVLMLYSRVEMSIDKDTNPPVTRRHVA